MAKSNKDVDRRSTFKRKTKEQLGASWATQGLAKNKEYLPTYYLLSDYDDDDLEEPIPRRNPCGWGSLGQSLRTKTGRK